MSPVVSVIVPAYGHADLISETIESVLSQSFQSFELIIVNDGSPDHTGRVVAKYLPDSRIHYFEKDNGGVAAARNYGFEKSKGKYIAFLDDDDLWPADKLQWQVSELEDDTMVGAVGGVWKGTDGNQGFPYRPEWQNLVSFESLFERCPFISPGQVLLRRDTFCLAGRMDPSVWGTDDYDLWLRIAFVSRVRVIDRVSLIYRIHQTNASRNMGKLAQNFVHVLRKNIGLAMPERREHLEAQAWAWVYEWTGRKAIDKIVRGVLFFDFSLLKEGGKLLWLYYDPYIRFASIRDAINNDFRGIYNELTDRKGLIAHLLSRARPLLKWIR